MDPITPSSNFSKRPKTTNLAKENTPSLRRPPDPPPSISSENSMEIDQLEEVLSQNSCFTFFEFLKNKSKNLNNNGLFITNADLDTLSKLMNQEKLNISTLIKKQEAFEEKMTTSMNNLIEKMNLVAKSTQVCQENNFPPLQSNGSTNQVIQNKWATSQKTSNLFKVTKNQQKASLPSSHAIPQIPAPPPPNKIVNLFKPSFFVIRKQPDSDPFYGMDNENIRQKVNKTLVGLNATTLAGEKVEVRGVAKLQSGDIKFYTASRTITSWCLTNKHSWTHLCDPELITKPSVFPVILHSVPAHFDLTNTDDITQLCNENNIEAKTISSARWLRKNIQLEKPKTHGSLVVNLLNKTLAGQIERGGLFFHSNFLKGAKYNKSPTNCFNCFELGHTAQFCKNTPFCSKCGGQHNSRNCEQIDDSDDNLCQRCVSAKRAEFLAADEEFDPTHEAFDFNHSITSVNCPSRTPAQTNHQYTQL